MMRRFKVIVPSFNSIDYIEKTLRSIEMQTDKQYDVCVIDDGSTIPGQRDLIQKFCERNDWKFLFNEKNHGALYGMVHAIPLLDCHDDDVVVVIDGDDWLAHPEVFSKLRQVYTENDVYLTWGQCELYPKKDTPTNYAQPIPEMVMQQALYRDIPFVFWHLGTFKYFLWRHLEDPDLRDEDGEYFMIMKDKATLYPMLEMAGEKIRFIPETLYIYNMENPLNDYVNTPSEEHNRVDALIRGRKRYAKLRFPNE
jgi:glycosyltransferase involved in cell wall biosynthesis